MYTLIIYVKYFHGLDIVFRRMKEVITYLYKIKFVSQSFMTLKHLSYHDSQGENSPE